MTNEETRENNNYCTEPLSEEKLETVSGGIFPYVCVTCGKSFPTQDTLRQHQFVHIPAR